MTTTEFALFIAFYGLVAAYCGWCLCLAAKRPTPRVTPIDDFIRLHPKTSLSERQPASRPHPLRHTS
jgi:hypothetical protein